MNLRHLVLFSLCSQSESLEFPCDQLVQCQSPSFLPDNVVAAVVVVAVVRDDFPADCSDSSRESGMIME